MRFLGAVPSNADDILVRDDAPHNVHGVSTYDVTTSSVEVPGFSVDVRPGTYALHTEFMYDGVGTPTISITYAFSGTASAFSMNGLTIDNNTGFPTTLSAFTLGSAKSLGALPTNGWLHYHGRGHIVVTVAGTLTLAFIRSGGTSATLYHGSTRLVRV